MVTNPSQTDLPTPPGSTRRFGVSRNVIERIAGTSGTPQTGGPYRLSAGPGGEAFPPEPPTRSSAHRNASEKVPS